VPLKLVTGPANAAKAGEVLGGLRERLNEEPILVVPAFGDVEHAQRELAERGAVFGAGVVRFARLFGIVAERVGYVARVASDLQRELIVEEAVRAASLSELAESANRPGFARAARRFVAELGRSMVEPQRFTRALRDWAGDGPRRSYADEVAALYARYRAGLDAAGLVDAELFAWRALDALRREPARWGHTPVFVYGFDDFTPLELDALETLAVHSEADVVVSLPYEAGRDAFKAIAGVHERLAALAAETVALEASDEHYVPESRAALHHLERGLFQPEPPGRERAGGALRLHTAGGGRAEVELAAAEVLELLRAGTRPGDVAVVFREPERYASLVDQVFEAYGIPYSIDGRVLFGHTAVGRGLLALLRCALLDGGADDLLAWLRTPGRIERAELADRLEADVRIAGARSADDARRIWESTPGRWELDEIDRLRGAGDGGRLLEELGGRLARLFAAPYRRRAHLLAAAELDDAHAFEAARTALEQMRELATPAFGAQRIHDTLARLRVQAGERAQPDRVQVADPGGIRARRFEAVFACGLQEGEFPRRSAPEPFLPDEERMEIAKASGLRLPLRENELERERYLFYLCASRAERLLVLSSRYCDEEGGAESPSFFLNDVGDLFEDLGQTELRRSLADVTWAPESAPTEAEWARAAALAGPRVEPLPPGPLSDKGVLAELAARDAFSAGALEAFADCPVKWFVEKLLDPDALEPDPDYMVRGAYAHKVLEQTYRKLHEATGSRRVTQGNLPEAERLLVEALRELQGEFRLSPEQTRVRAAVRRLEFDLLRYLRHEAGSDSSFEPTYLELEFKDVPLELGVTVRGRIDRVDTWDGHALVRDYKSGKADRYKVASWRDERVLQAPLYMIVLERLFEGELTAAGGVYTPLGGSDRASRGLVAQELRDQLGSDFKGNDWQPRETFEQHMKQARGEIFRVVQEIKQGRLAACPDTCAYRGGCSHPGICRIED
jgi:ATP-dependent helicase/DNAse subunit B